MHLDFFYNLFKHQNWLVLGLAYALFDYIYNVVMCYLTGGLSSLQHTQGIGICRIFSKNYAEKFHRIAQEFRKGAQKKYKQFLQDPISISWPLTVLFIPTILYGITHQVITHTLSSSFDGGIDIIRYRTLLFSNNSTNLQYYVWGIIIFSTLPTFFRYRYGRNTKVFFSESIFFNFSRLLLFNIPIGYMVSSVVIMWIDFSIAIYKLLLDTKQEYVILHPDSMYGLKPIYDTVILMGFGLIIISLLPSVLLIREKGQNYRWMYYLGMYGGLLTVIVLVGILIYQFDLRLGVIKQSALAQVVPIDYCFDCLKNIDNINTQLKFLYYELILTLPGSFPIPFWFEYVIGARSLFLVYELFIFTSPKSNRSFRETMVEILKGGS